MNYDLQTILMWCGLGLIAGVLAKIVMPGKDKGGLISTIILGIAGSFLGPILAQQIGIEGISSGLSVMGFLSATAGAFALLFVVKILRVLW